MSIYVYVDPLQATPRSATQGCRLIADSDEELHAFARRLGLQREWFHWKSAIRHYDLAPNKRRQAVRLGAVELSLHEMAERIRAWSESKRESVKFVVKN